jgi:hypothetical protein
MSDFATNEFSLCQIECRITARISKALVLRSLRMSESIPYCRHWLNSSATSELCPTPAIALSQFQPGAGVICTGTTNLPSDCNIVNSHTYQSCCFPMGPHAYCTGDELRQDKAQGSIQRWWRRTALQKLQRGITRWLFPYASRPAGLQPQS